ncbi:major facilitator superfamily domain-containing protein [Amylocarpus encephaloides]|uniref:Major facilitator superfamily domain-containing protein n=1 Tax=Amylocarpus encephaloides TaxID=45428 RepID=A0A9P7YEY6_9HELO|nr:major facilitator superfamily domain-containing protein [Amylocarpus encephaloides]
MAVHFCLAFSDLVLVAPLIKLFENSLCIRYHGVPTGGLDPELCQVIEVQRPLAKIRGWKSLFDVIPVLLVTIPFGKLGDRFGRRKILALALVGVLVSLSEVFLVCAFPRVLPIDLVWLSSTILLCGGGLNSASAYMWGWASESIPSANRSHGFYYIFAAFYVAEMVASFVATIAMDISPWIPCALAILSILLCLNLLALMPDRAVSPDDIRPANETSGIHDVPSISLTLSSTLNHIKVAASNRNVLFTIPVFLVGILRYTTLNILIQYAHVRFKQKISTGAAFYTETAVVNIVLFLFLIPRLTTHLRTEYKVAPQVIDLFLVRCSVIFMCLGALAIGLAPSKTLLPFGVSIFAAGFGSRVSGIALISYWVADDAKPTIYAAITVFESFGHACVDPSMQQIFAAALSLPEFWLAMPFFVASGLYFVAMIPTLLIRTEDNSRNDEYTGHQD